MMTTAQEMLERNVRMALGDLHMQVLMANARIAELEQLAAKEPEAPTAKPNGKEPPRQEKAN